MRSILSHLKEGVIVGDKEGNLLFFNEAAERILGRRGDLGLSGSWSSGLGCFLADTKTPYPEERLPLARALRGEVVPEREIFVRKNGRPDGSWINVSGTPLLTSNGETLGGMMVLRDVSSQKRSGQALRRLSRAVKQTTDAIYITDAGGCLIYVNPAFEQMTGHGRRAAMQADLLDVGLGGGTPEDYLKLRTAIVSGQRFQGTTANQRAGGAIYHGEQTLTPMLDARGTITHWVGVCRDMTSHRRIEEQRVEMELASDVQRRLYPVAAPIIPNFEVAGAVFSADATCGDYFDFIELPDGRVAIAVGDVSGHGLGPALVMTQVRAYLRSFIQVTDDLSDIFARVNATVARDFDGDFFVTMIVLLLDPKKGTLEYCNAGHIPGVLLDHAGTERAQLTRTGLPLGIFEDGRYEVGRAPEMCPGDVMLLLTDGVIESRSHNGDCLWEEGAIDVVQRHTDLAAGDIVERLYEKVKSHTGGRKQDDDVTMVVLKAGSRKAMPCISDARPPSAPAIAREPAETGDTIVRRAL